MAKLKREAVKKALTEMQGNVAATARKLGVARNSLMAFIKKHSDIQDVLDDARQSMVDNAESALNRAVLTGEAWAVCFTLKTQGRDRGYVERQEHEVTGANRGPVLIDYADDDRAAILRELKRRGITVAFDADTTDA